jgi:hypothetical protein
VEIADIFGQLANVVAGVGTQSKDKSALKRVVVAIEVGLAEFVRAFPRFIKVGKIHGRVASWLTVTRGGWPGTITGEFEK